MLRIPYIIPLTQKFPDEAFPMWLCKRCLEQVEDNFEICWNCGTSQEGEVDPDFQRAEMVGPLGKPLPADEEPLPADEEFLPKPVVPKGPCPKCHAAMVMPDVWLADHRGSYRGDNLSAGIDRDPTAWFVKGTELVELRASICGNCGYTELYATNPAALWQAYQDRKRNVQ